MKHAIKEIEKAILGKESEKTNKFYLFEQKKAVIPIGSNTHISHEPMASVHVVQTDTSIPKKFSSKEYSILHLSTRRRKTQ